MPPIKLYNSCYDGENANMLFWRSHADRGGSLRFRVKFAGPFFSFFDLLFLQSSFQSGAQIRPTQVPVLRGQLSPLVSLHHVLLHALSAAVSRAQQTLRVRFAAVRSRPLRPFQ